MRLSKAKAALLAAFLPVLPHYASADPFFQNLKVEICKGAGEANWFSGITLHTVKPTFSVEVTTTGTPQVGLNVNAVSGGNCAAFFTASQNQLPQISATPRISDNGGNPIFPSVQAAWRFDETSGATTAADSSAAGRTLTLTRNPNCDVTGGSTFVGAQTGLGNAIRPTLDLGATRRLHHATMSNNIDFSTKDFTVELWVQRSSLLEDAGLESTCGMDGTEMPILIQCQSASTGKCLHIVLRKVGASWFPYFGFYNDDARSNLAISNNSWHHVAFVLQGTSKVIYVDGVAVPLTTSGNQTAYQGTPVTTYVGGIPNGGPSTPYADGHYFRGNIDSMRVYTTALSPGTVAAHARGQIFKLNGDTVLGGDLSGTYCPGSGYPSNGVGFWNWGFGPRTSALPSTQSDIDFQFEVLDSSETLGFHIFKVNTNQSTMTTPLTPTAVVLSTGDIRWRIGTSAPAWLCDTAANTKYTITFSTGGSLNNYSSSPFEFLATTLTANTLYGISLQATYIDNGGNGNAVGPSAATPFSNAVTFANIPGAPSNLVITGPQSVNLDVNQGVPPNPAYTEVDIEGSNTGPTGPFFAQTSFVPFSAGNPRAASGLAKSSRWFFRSRARNLAGIITAGSALSTQTFVSQPATPVNFSGASDILSPPYCPKTAIRWIWDPVTMGSESPPVAPFSSTTPRYQMVTATGAPLAVQADTSTIFSANQFIETGLNPGTAYDRRVRAFDEFASQSPDIRYSLFAATASATTIGTAIPAPTGLTGTSLLPAVRWDWTPPPYLCPNFSYDVVNAETGSILVTLGPGNPSPTWTQVPMGPNQKSVVAVRANDNFPGPPPVNTLGALSAGVTAYSQANPPLGPLTATQVSTGSLVVHWDPNGNPGYTRYEVLLSSNNFLSVSTPVPISANLTTSSAPLTGLDAGTTYWFSIRAFNGRGGEPFGTVFSANATGSFMTLTTTPVLNCGAPSASQIDWTWSQPRGVASYTLFEPDGATAIVNTTALSHSSTTLGVNTSHGARIMSRNAEALGNLGPPVYCYTLSNGAQSLFVRGVSSVTATYSWSENGNPAYTFYEVNVATDTLFRIVVATLTPTASTVTVGGLFPATTYFARVRSYSGSQAPSAFDPVPPVTVSTLTNTDPMVSISSSPPSTYFGIADSAGIWHFDEGSGVSAADASGYANAARLACLTGGCASTPTWTGGPPYLGRAVSLTGQTSSLVLVPDQAQYNFTGSITVEAWARPATGALPNGASLVTKGLLNAEAFSLNVTGGRWRLRVVRPGPSILDVDSTSLIQPGAWTHVAGTYDSATGAGRIYVNGSPEATTTLAALARAASAEPVAIGNRKSATGAYDLGFAGDIDEAKIVARALSAPEVLAEYQGAQPSALSLPPPNDEFRLTIPPNAFSGPVRVFASADPINNPIRVTLLTLSGGLSATPTGQLLIPGSLVEIVPEVDGRPFTALLGSSVTLTMTYRDADGDRLLDGVSPPIAASTLRVYTLDSTVIEWVELPTTVDTAARTVTALVPHFSVFGLFGATTIGTSLSQVRVYPNPWRQGTGGRFDAAGVTFDNLPQDGSIRLFTLSGEKVRDIRVSGADAGRVVWDGRNDAGRHVASGVYFAFIQSAVDGHTTLKKLAIER